MVRRLAIWIALVSTSIVTMFWSGGIGSPAVLPVHAQGTPSTLGTPLPTTGPPPEVCSDEAAEDYDLVQEDPTGNGEWMVVPQDTKNGRPLYFVVITLEPGQCIPFESGANQKDGAVILIVNQGEITFVAEPFFVGLNDVVEYGVPNEAGTAFGNPIPFGTPVVVHPNEWVSQSTRVWFTYWNNSDTDEAIIWKAVWANNTKEEGCGGDCK